jgi:hypothetical protein
VHSIEVGNNPANAFGKRGIFFFDDAEVHADLVVIQLLQFGHEIVGALVLFQQGFVGIVLPFQHAAG